MSEPHEDPRPTGGDAPPVCPRHPDRVSYVRCQRCGRPACPDCQRPAAVGVHCVDCVAAASKTVRPTRSALGARLGSGRPVLTMGIIGLSVISYLLQVTVGWAWEGLLIFSPAAGYSEPWRFLTAAFLHSTGAVLPLHLMFNMYALWLVGPFLESMLGRGRFIALYVLSAIGGSVAMVLTGDLFQWVVGASGAVFGLFGAILVILHRLGRDARQILLFLGLNAVLGFVLPGIAWEAHLGGLVIGALLGAAFAYAPKDRRTLVSVVAVVGAALLLVALTLVGYAVLLA